MSVPDLIQHTCQDQKTARLRLSNGDRRAEVYFHEGEVVHAEEGARDGEEVVYEVLKWENGTFELRHGVKAPRRSITKSWMGLLLNGAKRLDETDHLPELIAKEPKMANIEDKLEEIMQIDGALAAALVDYNSGLTLGTAGSGMDIEAAAAGNTNVVRSKMEVMKELKLKGTIEDILITLTDQYHLIRLLSNNNDLFLYVALARARSNLGLARHRLAQIEPELVV